MDPVSMTASIIAILKLTSSLVNYSIEVKHASEEQKRLGIEASSVCSLLLNLKNRVEKSRTTNDVWFTQVKALGARDGPLEQLEQILAKMAGQVTAITTKERIKKAILWKFDKPEVEQALGHIERLKSLIGIALSNDAFKLAEAIHQEVTEINGKVTDTHVGVQQLLGQTNQETQIRLSNWLRVPDPSMNYHAALMRRQLGTGKWLLTGQVYHSWQSSTTAFLWLHGMAGCGKTVLSASVLEDCLEKTKSQPGTILGYFYFDFNDDQKQSSSVAARTLLLQLALQLPSGLKALQQLFQQCNGGLQQPNDHQVRTLLLHMIDQASQSYIIFDALDECIDRSEVLSLMNSFTASRRGHLRVLATSRRERDIEVSLEPIADYNINIQSAVVDADINTYVRSRLDNDVKLRKWQASEKEEIARQLMKKANGMFRWAYCQLEALRKCRQRSTLMKALSELPIDLDNTYNRILQTIEANGDLPNAITILRWLCFSNRPLLLLELVEILAIKDGDGGLDGFDPDERLPEPDEVWEICSSLISLSHNESDNDVASKENDSTGFHLIDDSTPTQNSKTWVRLAHFSVKEYLLSNQCPVQLEFEASACHCAISQSCLRYLQYLSEQSTLPKKISSIYPLAPYAAEHWWRHAQKLDEASASEPIKELILDKIPGFLMNTQSLSTWVYLYDIDRQFMNDSRTQDYLQTRERLAPSIYYAVCLGISKAIQKIIAQGADVNEQGGTHNNALQAASKKNHDRVVQILLDAGAKVSAQGGYYGNALCAASWHGCNEVVRALINAGADLSAEGLRGNALQTAAWEGHNKTAQILLEAGADINAQGDHGNALQIASWKGDNELVRMLLNAGADVNAQGDHGNALQIASWKGDHKLVQTLLDAGADVNVRGKSFGKHLWDMSPISELRGGFDHQERRHCNASEGEFDNALQAASAEGRYWIVQMLLKAGADINAQGGYHGNALQSASVYGHDKTVQILLEAGADVNAPGGEFDNALQAASVYRHDTTVRLLLEAGASIGVQSHQSDNSPYKTIRGKPRVVIEDHGHYKTVERQYRSHGIKAFQIMIENPEAATTMSTIDELEAEL